MGPREPSTPPIVAVVGATATGKSELAITLAERLDGEIINADAMQLYRGMDIGTAKVDATQRARVPHHLLDVLEVTEEASVRAYQQDARARVREIRGRGHVPVLVGGSGLYVRAALDDIRFPPSSAEVRDRYERRAEQIGNAALHAELRSRDPEAAAAIGNGDRRRIVRALEVGELTGESFRAFLPEHRYADADTVQIGLARPRPELHARIGRRVEDMMTAGLLDEVRALRERGLERGRTARRAIGYEQALEVLAGTMTPAEAAEATVVGTRRLVRRQATWFGRDPRITWITARSEAEDVVERALTTVERPERTGT